MNYAHTWSPKTCSCQNLLECTLMLQHVDFWGDSSLLQEV